MREKAEKSEWNYYCAITEKLTDMKLKKNFITMLLVVLTAMSAVAANPKREFRGAWLHTVHQGQYAKMGTDSTKAYLTGLLDLLKMTGHNAVVFQVRPSADALYPSELEPWSRFLTGTAGAAPVPAWDPLQFMIEECHKRGMELHAWLNPYRVTTSKSETLPPNHIGVKEPERLVSYDGKLYFDPGLPENREFIEKVVGDIVKRYNVDAIHMDDYFYPYPVKGVEFPDEKSFAKYGGDMNRGDWRRENVNLLIEGLHKVIKREKPWVRLGISPFGIWRNKKNDERGSDTNGLQNYDELYADVILWTEKGWVDYMLPQLYWELEKEVASSEKLAYWWNDNANGRHMYIGQDVRKTMTMKDINGSKDPNQLAHKIALSRKLPFIHGNCWWPGYSVTRNFMGIADSLSTKEQSNVAVIPVYDWMDKTAPEEVSGLKAKKKKNDILEKVNESFADTKSTSNDVLLTWTAPTAPDIMQTANAYGVYVFAEGQPVNLENAEALKEIVFHDVNKTGKTGKEEVQYILSGCRLAKGKYTIVVTVFDRAWNESLNGVKTSVKL